MSDMKVSLIAKTVPINGVGTEEFVASCAKGCYSEKPSVELMDEANEKYIRTLEHIVKSGHESVIEHLVFSFSIEGISRACANQLVRHRMASYSQQSQRYVKYDEVKMVIPPTVEKVLQNDRYSQIIFEDLEYRQNQFVEKLRIFGVPDEDIRYIYPIGMKTNITVTMNARSLLNFFKWRCCKQAQWEIREMADKMLEICKEVAPTIFKDAGPECRRSGCKEGKRGCKPVLIETSE